MSKNRIYIIGLLVVIVIAVMFKSNEKKELDWTKSYYGEDKIPYGTQVLKENLQDLFPNTKIKDLNRSTYEFLTDIEYPDNGSLVYINNYVNFDEYEFDEILDFVNKGNDVFISSNYIEIDTLRVNTKQFFTEVANFESILEEENETGERIVFDAKYHTLVNENFKLGDIFYERENNNEEFFVIDTLNTTVLGKTGFVSTKGEDEQVNFIKVPFGSGNFYLHTFPEAFTNYFVLKDKNYEYTASVLSYLKDPEIIYWDEYYKIGKPTTTSSMQHILNDSNLKWAYYIALIGVVFFIVFKRKREQRIVPVIEPVKNNTLAFVNTVAGMYFNKESHKEIALQKINFFYTQVRTKYHVDMSRIDNEFIEDLAYKSNSDKEELKTLFSYLEYIESLDIITEDQLIKINQFIEKFNNKDIYGRK
ncbi:DUF4350 domain-containing protein [Aureivirga sp. CE67]|uniref:DUF4350 domain-containing protein n=1 Tax=Aureivirga sp. CE67 TaxID=1788983 RepID=UPI0018CA66E3|nr:DUF4350 domain-containing protein [Aureivirga sp. CE67]